MMKHLHLTVPAARRFTAAVALATAVAAGGASAYAADPPDPAAQSLFEQGRAELACAKLAESQRLAPAPGTAFNLADCYAHIGRLASAWSLFRDVEAEANLAEQLARGRLARKRADELEPLLPKLLIQVGAPAPELELRRDGVVIGRAQWDTLLPVDIGEHLFTASAPHRKAWHTIVAVTKPAEIIVVSVPALEAEAGVVAAPAPASPALAPPALASRAEQPATPPPSVEVAARETRAGQPTRWPPIVAGVAGLGLLAASGATAAVAVVKYRDAGPCDGSVCQTQHAVDQRNDARTLGNVATVLGVAGAIGVSAAAVLWWLEPGRGASAASAAARTSWDVAVRADGLSLRRSW